MMGGKLGEMAWKEVGIGRGGRCHYSEALRSLLPIPSPQGDFIAKNGFRSTGNPFPALCTHIYVCAYAFC